ncbi:hypothetical protein MRX96_010547 [Rhipicephalus microplus]
MSRPTGRPSEQATELGDAIVTTAAASKLTFHFSLVLAPACDFSGGCDFDLVQKPVATATSTTSRFACL